MEATITAEPKLHPDLEPLAFLLGVWTGEGQGDYPTIDAFGYSEESTFTHSGKPLIAYMQKTWSTTGDALHSETGYLRPQAGGGVELVLAHGFGNVEVSEGSITDSGIELTSRHLVPSSTSTEIESVRRVIDVNGDTLTYRVDMAVSGQRLQQHLVATLKRRSVL